MQVIAYLHHDDVLLSDESHAMVLGAGHYVVSLGDQIHLKDLLDAQQQRYRVEICFDGCEQIHEDEMILKFAGCQEKLQHYLNNTTVH